MNETKIEQNNKLSKVKHFLSTASPVAMLLWNGSALMLGTIFYTLITFQIHAIPKELIFFAIFTVIGFIILKKHDISKESKKKILLLNVILSITAILIFFGIFNILFQTRNNNPQESSSSVEMTDITTISDIVVTTTEETTETTTSVTTITEPKIITVAKGYENKNNILMNKAVQTARIPKIDANRGFIEISKEDFSNITEDNYLEFCKNVVYKYKESYNYFTIDFGDGTGICYSGGYIYDATYGNLDDTGAVDEKLGSIQIDIESNEISSDNFTFAEEEITTIATTIETTQVTTTFETTITTVEKETESPKMVETIPTTNSYVLNTSTMKFHKPSCRDVEKISPENYATFDGSRDDVIVQGYDPCGHCNP